MTLNEGIIRYLREGLGFKGYANSDSGAVAGSSWGYNDKTTAEKVAKAVNAGTNIISGNATPEYLIEAVNKGLLDIEKVNESLTYTLSEMMTLGLFEDPYVNPEEAIALAND